MDYQTLTKLRTRMDVMIEEYKKKYSCEKCHEQYIERAERCLYKQCKHHTCEECSKEDECPICNVKSPMSAHSFRRDGDDFDNLLNISVKKSAEVKELKNKVLALQKRVKTDTEYHHKCVECESSESEQRMQLCATCHKLKNDDLENLENYVLCAVCSIKNHIRKGHRTVDFFPYLREFNYSVQTTDIVSKADELKACRTELTAKMKQFDDLSANISENFNSMTDMARRSNSTKKQSAFFEKIKKFVEESKQIHSTARMDMQNGIFRLEFCLTNITKWCVDEIENCVGESEVVTFAEPTDDEIEGVTTRRGRKRKSD